jgi:hypothetical protein
MCLGRSKRRPNRLLLLQSVGSAATPERLSEPERRPRRSLCRLRGEPRNREQQEREHDQDEVEATPHR